MSIGIQRRGYILRLEQGAKDLREHLCIVNWNVSSFSSTFEWDCHVCSYQQEVHNVRSWLQCLELRGYLRLFEAAGYMAEDGLDNLKGLTKEDLQRMGIHMRGTFRGN